MSARGMFHEMVLLDRRKHRGQKVAPVTDFSVASSLNAVFCAAAEFAEACKSFPLLFIRSGEGEAAMITPVCLLGLQNEENLFVEGGRWTAAYLPAFLRRYPFALAKVGAPDAPVPADVADSLARVRTLALQAREDGSQAAAVGEEVAGLVPASAPRSAELAQAVAIDASYAGLGLHIEGELLFGADGEPTPHLAQVMRFLDDFETAAELTRPVGNHLQSLGLLKEMRAQGPLPGGGHFSVDGFLVVDEDKLGSLPDEAIVALHRSGLLALIHAHLVSLSNLHALVERKSARLLKA